MSKLNTSRKQDKTVVYSTKQAFVYTLNIVVSV